MDSIFCWRATIQSTTSLQPSFWSTYYCHLLTDVDNPGQKELVIAVVTQLVHGEPGVCPGILASWRVCLTTILCVSGQASPGEQQSCWWSEGALYIGRTTTVSLGILFLTQVVLRFWNMAPKFLDTPNELEFNVPLLYLGGLLMVTD